MKLRMVADHHIVQNGFQIPQLNFYGSAVIVLDKLPDFFLAGDVDVVDNDLFNLSVQVWNRLMDDTVHQHHIQQFGGAVHEIRNINRNCTQFTVGDGPLPKGIQGILVF